MSITIEASTLDFSAPQRLPRCVYKVKKYSWAAQGGPKAATIEATGPADEIAQLIHFVRTPLLLRDKDRDAVWWGLVADITLRIGPLTVTRSIDSMRNRVAIRYSSADGAQAGRTSFAANAASVAAYGTRELVESLPSASLDQAVNRRDTLLALRSEPTAAWTIGSGAPTVTATLVCRGWWSTLDWLYYEAPDAEQSFEATPTIVSSFGWKMNSGQVGFDSASQRIYLFEDATTNAASGFAQITPGERIYTFNTGTPGANTNRTLTVTSAQATHLEAVSTSILFQVNPSNPAQGQIIGPASTFASFYGGDMIRVIGAGGNSGYYRIADRSFDGTTLTLTTLVSAAAAGPSITVRRGVYVRVLNSLFDESPVGGQQHYLEARSGTAQSMQLDGLSTLAVGTVKLMLLRSAAAPAQDVELAIMSESGGLPNTALGTATVASSTISSTSADWVTFTFSPAVTLSAGNTYFLSLTRSVTGTSERRGQFWLALDGTGGYALGQAFQNRTHSGGGGWIDIPGDAPFRMTGDAVTTEIGEAILDGYGQFFTAVEIVDASGVISQQRRNGNNTALQEVESLLGQGTSNLRPLYATVDPRRRVRVAEEAAKPARSAMLRLHADGRLTTPAGAPVKASSCPVGMWVTLHNILPPAVDLPAMGDPTVAFIDEAEYDPQADRWLPRSRGADSPWNIAALRRG